MGMTAQEGMFSHITDFAYARNAKQAVGFYLFHLFVGCVGFMLAVAAYGFVVDMPEGDASLMLLSKVSTVLSMLYVAYLTYRVLEAKGLLKQPKYWLYGVLGVAVSMLGMLLGLVAVACFSILHPVAAPAARGVAINEEE